MKNRYFLIIHFCELMIKNYYIVLQVFYESSQFAYMSFFRFDKCIFAFSCFISFYLRILKIKTTVNS